MDEKGVLRIDLICQSKQITRDWQWETLRSSLSPTYRGYQRATGHVFITTIICLVSSSSAIVCSALFFFFFYMNSSPCHKPLFCNLPYSPFLQPHNTTAIPPPHSATGGNVLEYQSPNGFWLYANFSLVLCWGLFVLDFIDRV